MSEINKSLYHITRELQIHFERYADDSLEWSTVFHQLQQDLAHKTDAVCGYIEFSEDQIELVNQKIKQLAEIRDSLINKNERFKNYVKGTMKNIDATKIEGPECSITIVQNPPSVQVVDESMVAEEYMRVVPETRTVDKKKILEMHKVMGEIPQGVEITRTERIKIKKF